MIVLIVSHFVLYSYVNKMIILIIMEQNPNEQPEYPVVTRKYLVQFLYPEDRSSAGMFNLDEDGFSTMASPTIEVKDV